MNTNEQNARINQLLKRYDEAKTTDAEEAELAEFFRTSTEVPEEWQDYAVLFITLEAADTLFIDKEQDLLPHKNRRNWWWGIGIAASIAIVAGLTFVMIPKYLKSTEPVIVQQTDTIVKEEHPQIVRNLDVPEPLQPDSLIETVTPQAPVLPHIEEEPHEEHIFAGLEMTAVDSALIGRIAGTGIGQPEPSERLMGREEFEKSYGGFGSGIHIGRVAGSAVDGTPWDSTLLQKLRDEGRTEIHPYDTLFGGGTGIGPAIRLGGNPASNAWRDSILVLLNGEEYPEFLTHFDINGKADIDMFDYFYQQNQLLMRMSYMWWFHKDMVQSYAEKYNRSALNFVVNLRTVKFTPVRKLTKKKIAARKLAYMLNKYRKGYDSNMWVDDYYSPEIFGNEYEELLFGLKAIHNAHNELEYFGAIHEDKNGVYVPLIREMEFYSFAKPDAPTTSHDEFMAIFQRAASKADTNLHGEDSVKYMAFMYGGKKIRKVKPFYSMFFDWELPRKRVFDFQVDEDAKSAWWCEVHLYPELHHESTPEDLRAEFYFCTYDKLYAKDCPEILTNKRFVEGTVVDSNGKPMEGVNVSVYFSNDGAKTDTNGHFSFWMPYKEAHILASQEGYKITHVPYTGEPLKMVLYRYGEKEKTPTENTPVEKDMSEYLTLSTYDNTKMTAEDKEILLKAVIRLAKISSETKDEIDYFLETRKGSDLNISEELFNYIKNHIIIR